MNIISGFCATLLLLCQTVISNFDFKYDTQEEFVKGIVQCTQAFNAVIPPERRVVVVLSVAQAGLESDWGRSRFAKLGNNFYGIIQPDPTEPHIRALNSDTLVKKYGRKCESVASYITLLNNHDFFKEYRKERIKQWVVQEVNVEALADTLHGYATDPFYVYKVKDTIAYLYKTYPTIFHLTTPA
tara:strand:- start:103 stop:657 length:555 start_codon:yes stop_codon:yes gene_type:complete